MIRVTEPQRRLLRHVRDYQSIPERNRGVADRLEALGLIQNMYTAYGVWMITDAGIAAIEAGEGQAKAG